DGVPTVPQQRKISLSEDIRRLFDLHEGRLGGRRIHAELIKEGRKCSLRFVHRLMCEMGLSSQSKNKKKTFRARKSGEGFFPDLVQRDFQPLSCAPGERLVGDITSFPVKNGWLHLAVVLDLSTRRVLGWKVSRRMQTNLVQGAMEVAVSRGLVREGAIFHSDRGGQYIAQGYKDFCQ